MNMTSIKSDKVTPLNPQNNKQQIGEPTALTRTTKNTMVNGFVLLPVDLIKIPLQARNKAYIKQTNAPVDLPE